GEPQDENERVEQEILPVEISPERVREGQHIDHRELCLRIPAEPDQGEEQEADAEALIENRPPNEPTLKEEYAREDREDRDEHGDLNDLGAPDFLPERGGASVDRYRTIGRRRC